ncbi:sulfotransferase family protein [Congregibacter sp.]|jgi:hypothetical protein|uniref:sulfotransferase family protein n=1 Tax=Congregibacter sp. TaxID=2744308 RepID=UPI0039E72225
MNDSTAVIVLGMHRSGTSALGGLLAELGVFMGKKLYAAQQGVNDKGFYENAAVVELNERILDSLRVAWDQPNLLSQPNVRALEHKAIQAACADLLLAEYAEHELWGIKDPRLCLTLPAWRAAIEKVSGRQLYLLPIRDPREVCASLHRRDKFSIEKSLYIWMNYTLSAWRYSESGDRVVLPYSLLMDETAQVMLDLCNRLGVSATGRETSNFIDSSLRRNTAGSLLTTDLGRLALSVYEALAMESIDEPLIETLFQEYSVVQAQFPQALIEHIASVTQAEIHFRELFEDAYYSWWWKLARPVKFLEEFFRKKSKRVEFRPFED